MNPNDKKFQKEMEQHALNRAKVLRRLLTYPEFQEYENLILELDGMYLSELRREKDNSKRDYLQGRLDITSQLLNLNESIRGDSGLKPEEGSDLSETQA